MSRVGDLESDNEEELGGWDTPKAGIEENMYTDSEDELDVPVDDDSKQATMRRATVDGSWDSISEADGGLLNRDKQQKTAFFDHAAERQMSQSEAKQIYQRHQQAQQTINESSQSLDSSAILEQPAVYSPVAEAASSKLGHGMDHESSGACGKMERDQIDSGSILPIDTRDSTAKEAIKAPSNGNTVQLINDESGLLRADQIARDHGKHPGLPHEYKPPLLATEGIHGAGAGIGLAATGGFASGDAHVTAELRTIYTKVQRILDIRHKYMRLSLQASSDNPKNDSGWRLYPPHPEPVWDHTGERTNGETTARPEPSANADDLDEEPGSHDQSETKPKRTRKMGHDVGEDFVFSDLEPLPGPSEMTFRLDDSGVFQVYEHGKSAEFEEPIVHVPTIREFYMDLDAILTISSDGPSKSFAFRRLQYLEGKFNLYALLNEYQEVADTKAVPHRDFYNVRKVDTHVHHSACMNQKHLLRFIKSKMKKCPDEVVLFRDGKHLTLKEVFESISLTAYDLSIDTLDMHVRISRSFGMPSITDQT